MYRYEVTHSERGVREVLFLPGHTNPGRHHPAWNTHRHIRIASFR